MFSKWGLSDLEQYLTSYIGISLRDYLALPYEYRTALLSGNIKFVEDGKDKKKILTLIKRNK